ncbi:hypothetical protein VPNG_09681 [Cytospora leucostoma]|uniref:Yeast cell wall synthesis Kre9/Knh1-like N-terminal domain-containing protein n=1 Tax=Cytospora leucostoma TaxID=1230097 RepID=A0A423VMK0_9PEZI|nr:hypothetical protein VPNG_09681 [Cytospora leucostoma]
MRVTISAATLLAWVSTVVAQTSGFDAVLTPTKDEVLTAGSTYTITWDYSATYSSSISIQLLEGETSTTLQLGDVIGSFVDNSQGSYSWTIDSSLGSDATYGLKIIYNADPSIFQYSNPFQITQAATSAAATTAAAASSVAEQVTTAAPAATTSAAVAGNAEDTSSTVFSTEWVTITSCAATVTDCPARSTVTSSTVKPLATTVKPASSAVASSIATEESSAPASPASSAVASSAAESSVAAVATTSAVSSVQASATSIAVPTTFSAAYPAGNSTGKGAGGLGTVTLPTSTATGASSSSTAIVTAGAGKVAAGSAFALVASLIAAVFAL